MNVICCPTFLIQEMENLFRRAVEIEQENESSCVSLRLQAEGEYGVHYFENQDKSAVGAMVAGDISSLSKDLVTRLIPEFRGFALTLLTIPEVSPKVGFFSIIDFF